ncbi:hypothetical protein AB9F35_33885, partial [Rhizobium leguminosarum]
RDIGPEFGKNLNRTRPLQRDQSAVEKGDVSAMKFMDVRHCRLHDVSCLVSRSGYSGEDGFEISIPSDKAEDVTMRLLEHPDVQAIGLGARDSL